MSIESNEIADRLEEYATILRTGSISRAIGLWTIWQSYNEENNPLRDDRLDRSAASAALNTLASAAMHETIMIVVRVFDKHGRGGRVRVSFPVLGKLIKNADVREVVESRAKSWLPDGDLAEENVQAVRTAIEGFERRLGKVLSEKPNRLERLRNFRNEFLAHNLKFEQERDRPILRDITGLLEEARALSDQASIAFGGSMVVWEPLENDADRSASELWRLVRQGLHN